LFVQDFLEALEDAPLDIEALQSELVIFQTSIDKFQATLNVVDDDAIGEDVRLALEYSNKAINDLRKVVSKLADRRHGCITNFSMVVRKVRISRHVKTLERAWMLLLCAQMNMSMWVQ
jgi:D-mannonate dehydratase